MIESEMTSVRAVLARLRSRIRGTWALRGVALTVGAASTATVFSFLLDYLLELPLAVRAVHLVLMLVALWVVAHVTLVRPLRTPTTEQDLAQAVEHGAPDLKDRLVSALDFERRLGDPAEAESRQLMVEVVRDAAARVARIDPGLLVDARPARRAVGAACVSLLALVTAAATLSDDFALWVRRGLVLADVAWPRRTVIRVLDFPAEGPRVVTRGDDLRVVATVEGWVPEELVLHYEEFADTDPDDPGAEPEVAFSDTRRMYAVDGEDGRFAFDFRSVSASFRFWVTGGDDVDEEPLHSVLALVPPRIASISGRIRYPAYAGLADGEVRDPSFEVLKGSRVEMTLAANMPLSRARLVPPDGEARDVEVAPDRRTISLAFDVESSVDFHLELTADRGQTNRPEDDVYHVRAGEDRPPELRVLFPPSRLYRTPNGIVPVKVAARDDFEVARVTLDAALGQAPLGTFTVWPPEGAPPPPPAERRRVAAYRPLDLAQFAGDQGPQVKPGDVVHLAVRAADSRGNETASGDLAVEVLSVEDLERRLSQRQGTLREELTSVRRNQSRARQAIAELRAAVGPGAPDAPALERGRDLQVDQGRVTNDLVRFLGGVHQVFDTYVLCRVGAATTVDRLVPLYHEALAQPAEGEADVFPRALYAKIVAEKRADRLFDPEVLGALLDIMDVGDRVSAELSPAVYQSLLAWAGEEAHDAALLDRAEKLSAELAARLAELDQRMQRWEDLNALIEMAREIRNRQDQLSKEQAGEKGLVPK